MTYSNALILKEANKQIIGKQKDNSIIDEIIITPTDPILKIKFLKLYIELINSDAAILPFSNSEVELLVVFDKHKIEEREILIYSSLHELSKDFKIVIN